MSIIQMHWYEPVTVTPRTPWANTVLYFPLTSDAVDIVNNISLTSSGTTNYTTVWWVTSANFTRDNCLYNANVSWLPQWDVAKTISLWAYITAWFVWWAWIVLYGTDAAWKVFWLSWYSNSNDIILTKWWSVSSEYTPTRNVWSNYIFTYSPENKRVLYVNGTAVVTWSETAPTEWTKFYIGANIDSELARLGYKWNLSNVILENKERTAQEVSDYYNQTKWDYWVS